MGALGWLDDGVGSFDRVALVAEEMKRSPKTATCPSYSPN